MKELALKMLTQMFIDRTLWVANGAIKDGRTVLVAPHELTQVENVTRVFGTIAEEAWYEGRQAALRLVVSQAEHCAKGITKTVLTQLTNDIRLLEQQPKA